MRDVGDGDADDVAAAIARIVVRHGVHGIVVVLGIGRIDGDEGHFAPVLTQILTSPERRRTRSVCFFDHAARKYMRDVVGMDCDQADGAFAFDRSEPFHDGAACQPEPAIARDFDGDEIAVDRPVRRAGRNAKFAAKLLLVDRHQAAAPAGEAAENTQHPVLGAIDELDDARARFVFARSFDAKERAVADAGDFTGAGATGRNDADNRRGAVGLFVPFGRPRQKLAVGVAAGNVSEHHRRQCAGVMQPFAMAIDLALLCQFTQHAIERRPVRILGAERARDFTHAHFAGALADEGKKLLARGESCSFHGPLIGRVPGRWRVLSVLFGSFGWRFARGFGGR